jgi:glutaredoxin-related protein
VVNEVSAAVERDAVVVVGMATNVFVKQARKSLTEAGIPFTYLEYGGYLSRWKERLAIKMWSGWPTFPQVFVHGRLVGGANDLKKLMADDQLKVILNAGR